MTVLDRLASSRGRNDEIPNQELAAEIAAAGDALAVAELIGGVTGRNQPIASDCIKVLYEIGERRPDLIAFHVETFLDLLASNQNRLVWGAMTALGQIAPQTSAAIWSRIGDVIRANDGGSVITQDWGVRVLAQVAAREPLSREQIIPYLERFLGACIPRDVPKHAESMLPAITPVERDRFLAVLRAREPELSPAQTSRLRKVVRQLG